MEPTDKIDPDHAHLRPEQQVSLLFSWGDRAFALALRDNQSCVIGRVESADVVIDDPSLSRAHARLSLCHDQLLAEDLGSTNGCVLNGMRVTSATMRDGDLLQLGAIEMRVCARSALPERTTQVSHASFMRTLEEEVARARLSGRSLAVLALKHEVALGTPERPRLALRPFDRYCSFAPNLDLVLLVEHDAAAARSWLEPASLLGKNGAKVGIASYPRSPDAAEQLVARALEACRAAGAGEARELLDDAPRAATQRILLSPNMVRLYDLVARVARTTMPVLIHGETGAGKELVARAVHDDSPRSKARFRALNCATIPVGLIESMLFGHERGSFSGAERQMPGVFEQAAGGTVFLDEVAELSTPAQAALLRVLEQGRLVRVGGIKEIEVDVRIVAATHRDLRALVQRGSFREDLLFRLDALTLSVPPLRDRRVEILPLAEHFLAQARVRWGARVVRLSEDARDALLAYAWPGNVRQLRNVIERAVVVCSGDAIDLEDLPPDVWNDQGDPSPLEDAVGETSPMALEASHPPPNETASAGTLPLAPEGSPHSLTERVRAFEIALIRQALEVAGGNQSQAARLLGIPRRTLASKVHAYRMVPNRS